MFDAIFEKDLPKNLQPLTLSRGTINTSSNLFVSQNKVYKLYKEVLPFYAASDLYDLKQQGLPYAVFPESFIIDESYHVTGEVQPFINGTTLTENAKFHQEKRDINERIPKMYQLISYTEELNKKGYKHNDLHSDNFLVDTARIYAIDLDRIRKGKNISEHQKHLNEILISYLFGLTNSETKSLLTTDSYKLKESLNFAPNFLKFILNGIKTKEDVLDELYDHEKEASQVHLAGKSF